jgi:hypothetical protein
VTGSTAGFAARSCWDQRAIEPAAIGRPRRARPVEHVLAVEVRNDIGRTHARPSGSSQRLRVEDKRRAEGHLPWNSGPSARRQPRSPPVAQVIRVAAVKPQRGTVPVVDHPVAVMLLVVDPTGTDRRFDARTGWAGIINLVGRRLILMRPCCCA